MARFAVGVPLILVLVSVVSAQNPPQSNPQAVSFASQSIAALTGGSAIHDVTLTGNVTWSGGATPEMGTAILLASGTRESRMNLALPNGTRTEIRDASTGVAQGEWIGESGKSGQFACEECATDADWFF